MVTITVSADANYSTLGAADSDHIKVTSRATLTVNTSTVDLGLAEAFKGTWLLENTTSSPIIVTVGHSASGNIVQAVNTRESEFKVQGSQIQIGTGTGVAGQTVTLPTSDTGANLPNLAGLWVDHGDTLRDSEAVLRPYAHADDADYAVLGGPEFAREIFKQDTTANTVTFKTAIPLGAAIYMGSVILNLSANATSSFPRISISSKSYGEFDWCHFTTSHATKAPHVYFPSGVLGKWQHTAIDTNTVASAALLQFIGELHSVIFRSHSSATSQGGVTFSSSSNTTWTAKNCMFANGDKRQGLIAAASGGAIIEKCRSMGLRDYNGQNGTSFHGFTLSGGSGHKLLDCVSTFNAPALQVANTSNVEVDNFTLQCGARSDSTVKGGAIRANGGSNITLRNIVVPDPAVTSGARHTNLVIGLSEVSGVLLNGADIYCDDSMTDVLQGVFNNSRFNDITVRDNVGLAVGTYDSTGGGYNSVSNVYYAYAPTLNPNAKISSGFTASQMTTGHTSTVASINVDAASGFIDAGRFVVMEGGSDTDSDKTVGRVIFSFSQDTLGKLTPVVLTGELQANLTGGMWLSTVGDKITMDYDAVYNVSATGAFPALPWPAPLFYEAGLRLRRSGGSYSSLCTTAAEIATAFAALPASADNEVEFQVELEKILVGTQAVAPFYLDLTLTGDDHPFSEAVNTGLVSGIVAGSRLQVYNQTTSTELVNTTVAGTSFQFEYAEGSTVTTGDTIRIRLAEQSGTTAKGEFSTAAIAGANGFSVLALQTDDLVYNAFGVDGSTLTQFTADYVNDEVDITVASDFNMSDLYAWWIYNLTTADGMREFFGGIEASDQANFLIKSTILSAYIDNTTATSIKQLDNRRIYREDLTYPVKMPTTGGGGVDVVWRNTILIPEGGGGADPAEVATAVWAAATSANNDSGSFGRMTQQTHLSATKAGSLYQEEEE